MGRDRKNRASGFKPGHQCHYRVEELQSYTRANPVKRMSHDDFLDNIHERDGMITENDPDNQPVLGERILRPQPEVPLEEDARIKACVVTTDRAGMEDMKLFHPKKLEELFNGSFRSHKLRSPGCIGNLLFNEEAEIKKGLCFKEQLKCSLCTFVSERVPLYQEVPSSKRGSKAAAPNIGMQIGLSHTPAGNQDISHILNAAGIAAPAQSSMQRLSNSIMNRVVEINTKDMADIRRGIKQGNMRKGLPAETPIRVEGDAQYNNSLRSGCGKTPFQPATQAVYTISENETKSKKIIGVQVTNKLCKKCGGKQLTNALPCTNCTANVPLTHTIGDESHMVVECVTKVMAADIEIKYVTTDQDSQAFKGFQTAARNLGKSSIPEKLHDTFHLSKSLRRAANKETFSRDMFSQVAGLTKEKVQNRFALDLAQRCQAEYAASLQKHGSDTSKNIRHLSYCSDAIIKCFQGDHSLCLKHSLVCHGQGPKLMNCRGNKIVLKMTEEDEGKLRSLVSARLGRKSILLTKLGTNSQKSEAINSAYVRSVPKFKNFTRNVQGRVHSRIHMLNNGRCISTISTNKQLGINMFDGSRVVKQLMHQQNRVRYDQKRQQKINFKRQRSKGIVRKYELYSQRLNNAETYSKRMLDPKNLRKLKSKADHTYSKS